MGGMRRTVQAVLILLVVGSSVVVGLDLNGQDFLKRPRWRKMLQSCVDWSCPAQQELLSGALAMDLNDMQDAQAKGADVNLKLEGGWTLLHLAAKRADRRMAALLIQWGADVNAATDNGTTPLHMAANYGFYHFAAHLVYAGANVQPRDRLGFTPLHFAAFGNTREDYDLGKVRVAGATIAQSQSPWDSGTLERNAKNPSGVPPDYLGIAHLLLINRAEPSPETIYSETPLHYVSTFDRYQICQVLIAHGADIDRQDIQKETPLHEAVAYGAVGVTQVLLEKGANTYLKEENGSTPREFICQCRKYKHNPSLNKCAPQKCVTDYEDRLLGELIDKTREEQG